ncbi:hypothetical protein BCF33_2657 [Hasllibacter halocynthiae]|uniref:Lipoprotein n=1 Tax=Hasllibacter halocynthiae TaxID=595589 RepID=A0A2T0X4A1_9RHOB|nr:hypothetical protein [Hasllibacter halocynthiae]PRY93773.1 hypothetical protein BCF33_2657 [Hasllibacter halocynthiae]
MTRRIARASGPLLLLIALGACAAGGAPNSQDQQVNDPSFSGVTNTDALDSSYTPDSSAL